MSPTLNLPASNETVIFQILFYFRFNYEMILNIIPKTPVKRQPWDAVGSPISPVKSPFFLVEIYHTKKKLFLIIKKLYFITLNTVVATHVTHSITSEKAVRQEPPDVRLAIVESRRPQQTTSQHNRYVVHVLFSLCIDHMRRISLHIDCNYCFTCEYGTLVIATPPLSPRSQRRHRRRSKKALKTTVNLHSFEPTHGS